MEKSTVIKLRDELKCGKNIPLRILINNSFTVIDESHTMQFTKWDDENGIVYSFRLVDINSTDHNPSDKENAIAVFAVSYSTIEALEAPVFPLSELDTLFDKLSSGGCTFGAGFTDLIKHTYEYALHPDRYRLSPTDMTNMLGKEAVSDKDDYYNHPGKFTESFKETVNTNRRNKNNDSSNTENP